MLALNRLDEISEWGNDDHHLNLDSSLRKACAARFNELDLRLKDFIWLCCEWSKTETLFFEDRQVDIPSAGRPKLMSLHNWREYPD